MSILIITVCSNPEHAGSLVASAAKQGWELTVLKVEWRGFGTKLLATKQFLLDNPNITEFIFVDAYDVVVLGTEKEFIDNTEGYRDTIILGCEKNLWPPPLHPFSSAYRDNGSPFRYINSGMYYAGRDNFLSLMDRYPPFYEIDDQWWMNMCFILSPERFTADFFQEVFNNHSFIADGEYEYINNRVRVLNNFPIFIHFNGKTVDEKFNELIKI